MLAELTASQVVNPLHNPLIVAVHYRSANYTVWGEAQRPSWGKAKVLWDWRSPPKKCCRYGGSYVRIKKVTRRSGAIVWEEKEEEEEGKEREDGRIEFNLTFACILNIASYNSLCTKVLKPLQRYLKW